MTGSAGVRFQAANASECRMEPECMNLITPEYCDVTGQRSNKGIEGARV